MRPHIPFGVGMATICLAFSSPASAGFIITPTFDTSIMNSGNKTALEGAINTAIHNLEGLYLSNVNIPVTFSYSPAAAGILLSTGQVFYDVSYASYKSALQSDSAATPTNLVLVSALTNLPKGNDADGANDMALTAAQVNLLSGNTACSGSACDGSITININSNQTFSLSEPTPGNQFDLIGGLEHELDETMGGGGAGSTLNSIASSCVSQPTGFFCDKYGATDLLRYSANNTPGFSTLSTATAYLSINGGATRLVSFNQDSGGDYGDFAPSGTGAGQRIQNAFNSTGQDATYTTSSPEFTMLEAIGWDGVLATPEPGTIVLVGVGLALIGVARRRLV